MTIMIICHHCRSYNKHRRDDKDYEWKNPEFTSFSEAHKHMLEFPDAWMDFTIRENEEE